jgi:hypothetical protein
MKKPNPPKLVTIAVTTTITIVFWIFFTLYQVLTSKAEPSVSEKLLSPIIPELDRESLLKIKDRIFFEEGSYTFNPQVTGAKEVNVKAESTPTPPLNNTNLSPTPTEPTEMGTGG